MGEESTGAMVFNWELPLLNDDSDQQDQNVHEILQMFTILESLTAAHHWCGQQCH
jgi:hypothetical protein